jgi:hypothetical protein
MMAEIFKVVLVLGQKMEELLPAIDLQIYLGEWSYPGIKLCWSLYDWLTEEDEGRCGSDEKAGTLILEMMAKAVKVRNTLKLPKQAAGI